MGRYLRKLKRIGSIGPNEERGSGLWVGYELVGVNGDLSEAGLVSVDDWPEDRIADHGVVAFVRVEPDDDATYEKLGIRRKQ